MLNVESPLPCDKLSKIIGEATTMTSMNLAIIAFIANIEQLLQTEHAPISFMC